jgi:long-chain acyl-CoA synthetase
MNIAEEIFKKVHPDAVAIFCEGQEISYGSLDAKSAQLMRQLYPLIESLPCPRVGLDCPDGADYIAHALGILRAGGCFVPIAPELSPTERQRLIEEVRLDVIVKQTATDGVRLESPAHTSSAPAWLNPLANIRPAFIRFTSGTTGHAKGITLSHETLLERITAANDGLGISAADRILWVLPMSHHFAVSIMLYLWNGAGIVLPQSNLPGDLLAASHRTRATVLYAAPFHYEMLSGCQPSEAVHWRLAVSTTAPLAVSTAERFSKNFGIFPSQGLGIIEVGLPCLNFPSPAMRPASIGRPQASFQAKLNDSKLFLRGPGCLDAYLSPWQPRSQILDDEGWFATGDIAEINDEGFVTLLGRASTAISIGGMKFFPDEVEAVLNTHPAVARSRVIARQHADFGTVPIAEVLIVPGAEAPPRLDLLKLCRRELSAHKVPVELHFVDDIPQTPSGKIKRA